MTERTPFVRDVEHVARDSGTRAGPRRPRRGAHRSGPLAAGLPVPGPRVHQPPGAPWESRYRWAVIVSDAVATIVATLVVGGLLLHRHGPGAWRVPGILAAVTLVVVCGTVGFNRGWHPSILGQGAEEFRRLGRGLAATLVVLALGGLILGRPELRPWVFVVVPAVAVCAVAFRYQLRRFLHRARRSGRCLLPVLAAGGRDTVRDLIDRTRRAPHLGWRVDAACVADAADIGGVPVLGGLGDLARHVREGGYRIVAVTADAYWSPLRLRQLAWDLEGSDAEMVVAPTLMEIAGPRLHVTGVLGMPMLRVAAPVFTGTRRVVKEVVDRAGALALLAVLSPVLLGIAVLISVDSRGPVFHTQRRIGKDGHPFTMLKFRTMVRDPEALRATLLAARDGSGLVFRLRGDPRVTRVGRRLLRYSLDELPTLWNVLTGHMSLVGPRPPRPDETARYGPDVRRRLLVKPGLTGLLQVSGRGDLSWDEAVRLDLRYVEDWSLAMDAAILWKTLRAVFRGDGTYGPHTEETR